MATLEAYLLLAGYPLQVLGVLLGVVLFLSGAIVLFRSRHTALVVRGVAGAWFFGYFTYSMAMVCIKYSGPVRPVQAVWAGVGCTIGLGILGSAVSAAVAFVGDITIGLAAGWSIWAVVAGMVPSQIGNLVVGVLLSIAGGVAVRLQPLRFGEVAVCWLGSTLLTQGLMGVIINSMLISSSSTDAVQAVYLITYIIAILFTVCLFGLTLKLQSASILCAEKEGFDNTYQP